MTPERTDFVRYRRLLIAYGLDSALFAAVTAQLKVRAVWVKTGTLIDATIIALPSQGDEEGRWVKHKGRAAVAASRPLSARIQPQRWWRRSR